MFEENFLARLESGELRAALLDEHGQWQPNPEVKAGILSLFAQGKVTAYPVGPLPFFDKHNLLPRNFETHHGVRLVPGGTSVRSGSYLAPGVIVMPPSYINVGAYVGAGTMVDSHVLVGSCAQIGERVHLSAGVQIGGVLEPVGARPVVIEDDAFIGADAVIVEGVVVKKRAVIAPGVILSKSIPVYDLVHKRQLEKNEAIPEGAVVVSGQRPIQNNIWAQEQGLSLYAAIIVKYRDDQSNKALTLEEALR